MVALMMAEVPQLTHPWVVPSVGPRSHPAFRCLKYGKAGRAWYLFSRAVFHVGIVQLTTQSSLARIYTYGKLPLLNLHAGRWPCDTCLLVSRSKVNVVHNMRV